MKTWQAVLYVVAVVAFTTWMGNTIADNLPDRKQVIDNAVSEALGYDQEEPTK